MPWLIMFYLYLFGLFRYLFYLDYIVLSLTKSKTIKHLFDLLK